jgi:acyl carrier protein
MFMVNKSYTWFQFERKIREIISEQIKVSIEKVQLNTHLANELGVDSLDAVEFYLKIDDEFGIEVHDTGANTIAEGIQNYVQQFPRDTFSIIDTKILSFHLRPDGTTEVILQMEDGSWTYADGKKLLPSKLYLKTFSKWTSKLKQLEDLINDPKTKEQDLQKFFEEFPELIAGDDYDMVMPQATISFDEKSSWRADFILAPISQTEFSKIIEFKLPSMSLVKKPTGKHFSFTSKLWGAICQLKDYGRAFDMPKVHEEFKRKYGRDVYKPDLHLIAGRQWDLQWIDNIRDLRRTVPIQIEDWDSALDRLKRRYQ